jgi:HIV Tat-specific factor 1
LKGKSKKQKADGQREERKNTAVYVTSLPLDVTVDEIFDTFSKFGIIAESTENDEPRIKLYANDKGTFKGDALIGEVWCRLQCYRRLTVSSVLQT